MGIGFFYQFSHFLAFNVSKLITQTDKYSQTDKLETDTFLKLKNKTDKVQLISFERIKN